MSEYTREDVERIREALRSQRWRVARLHAIVSEAGRSIAARSDDQSWGSPAADVFRARVVEVSAEVAAARAALSDAIQAIDRALLSLADVAIAPAPMVGMVAR
jgi:hypothetical protein